MLKTFFSKFKFSKDLLAPVGYLNSKILSLYLNTELSVLQVQTLTYCAAMAVVRTLGKKTILRCNTIRSHTRKDPPWKIHLQNEVKQDYGYTIRLARERRKTSPS